MLMFLEKMRKNKKGFTLTELIVVVAILGVLAAVATPAVMGYVADARNNTDSANAKVIENCLKIAAARDANNSLVTTAGALVPTTVGDFISGVNTDGGSIPASLLATASTFRACQNAANSFFVNTTTLEVRVASTAPADTGWLELN